MNSFLKLSSVWSSLPHSQAKSWIKNTWKFYQLEENFFEQIFNVKEKNSTQSPGTQLPTYQY